MRLRVLILVLFMFFLITSCNNPQEMEPIKEDYTGMGTVTSFIVFGEKAEEGIEKAKEIMIDLEEKMSLTIKNSEINKLNSKAGIEKVKVSSDTYKVISRGIYFSQLTKGSFDISVGPITKLWNIGQEDERIPSQEEIDGKLPLVDYKSIILDPKEKTIYLKRKGMKLDLGAIAKGYAADKIVSTFKDIGIENALINIGGNIKVIGENPQKNRPWKVGLRHPRDSEGNHFAIANLETEKTVVTSGDYERFFEKEGIRYHHIFDANIGKPSNSDIIGVSIITENSMDADGLSTCVFLLGSHKGVELIEEMEGVEAIIVTKDLKVIMTKGADRLLEETKTQL